MSSQNKNQTPGDLSLHCLILGWFNMRTVTDTDSAADNFNWESRALAHVSVKCRSLMHEEGSLNSARKY